MVEGQMHEVGEEDMVDALELAHGAIRKICQAQLDLAAAWEKVHGPIEARQYELEIPATELVDQVEGLIGERIAAHIRAPYEKKTFYGGLRDLEQEAVDTLTAADESLAASDVGKAAGMVSKKVMREMVLSDQRRIDSRNPDEVRSIWV